MKRRNKPRCPTYGGPIRRRGPAGGGVGRNRRNPIELTGRFHDPDDYIDYWYAIITTHEDVMEENLNDLIYEGELPEGTEIDWEEMTEDLLKLEWNVFQWMKKNIGRADNTGHDSYGDLVGSVTVEEGSEWHEEIEDLIDRQEILRETWEPEWYKGVSDLASRLVDVEIEFQRKD